MIEMDVESRAEVRELLYDVLSGHSKEMKGRFDLIDSELKNIHFQTTKTNGRVIILENKVENLEREGISHFVNCPQIPRINELEKYEFSRKAVYKFIGILWGTTLGIIGATVAIIELVLK